jgi:hypothetical protein
VNQLEVGWGGNSAMQNKLLPLFGALLLATNAHAALVDFDSNYSVTSTDYTNPANSIYEASSQGFSFGDRAPTYLYAFRLENSASSSGNYMVGLSQAGGHPIDIWREDGQLFSLTSLDLGGVMPTGPCSGFHCYATGDPLYIHGYDAAGTLINALTAPATGSLNVNDSAYWQTIHFDSTWTNLAYVTVKGQYAECTNDFLCQGFGSTYVTPSLDNVNISVVPIPGAVWLFASALGLMGWRSRRH